MSPDKTGRKRLTMNMAGENGGDTIGGGIASRARGYVLECTVIRIIFESRKLNKPIEVAHDVFRKEAVAVTGTWDDSKMYVPYPYEDVILNPNLDNSWKTDSI